MKTSLVNWPPLVGVEDLWGAVFDKGLFECLDAESGVQRIGEPPRKHFSGSPVHDGYQVHESPCHGDVGDVGAPDLIGLVDGPPPQQVGIDRMLRLPPVGARFGGQGFDPHDEHQTPDPVPSYGHFRSREVINQGTALHPGLLDVKLINPAHQFQVVRAQTRGRTAVIAGTGDPKKLAATFIRNFRMPGGNHLLFLRPAKLRPGRLDKKSFSALSLPVTRCNSATSAS